MAAKKPKMSANFAKTMGLKSIHEYNSDLYLDTSKSINYENNLTIKSSFWVEKLTKFHLKMAAKKPKMSANFAKTMGLKSIHEYNSDLYLDTSKSINYENNLTIKSSFWVEKLTKYPQNCENPTYLAAAGYAVPKSVSNADSHPGHQGNPQKSISNNITVKTCIKPKKE